MRCIIKKVGQEPEFVEAKTQTPWSELCKSEKGSGFCDAAGLGRTKDGEASMYVYFDDLGYTYRNEIGYNCNIPSGTESFENKLYGDIVFIRTDYHGESIDCKDEDMKFVKKIIFYSQTEKGYN